MIRKRVPAVLLVVALFVAWLPLAAEGPRWMPIGPDGASVYALAVGPGVVYAGTASSGVYKSTDGGESWAAAGGNQGLSVRGWRSIRRTAAGQVPGTSPGALIWLMANGRFLRLRDRLLLDGGLSRY